MRSITKTLPVVFLLTGLLLWSEARFTPAVAQQAGGAPALSELQRLKIETINLRVQLQKAFAEAATCQTQLAAQTKQIADAQATDAVNELNRLTLDINAANPRHTWDPKTGQFTPKPEAPAPPTKE